MSKERKNLTTIISNPPSSPFRGCVVIGGTVKNVMPNLFRHLIIPRTYETLKQVQGDKKVITTQSLTKGGLGGLDQSGAVLVVALIMMVILTLIGIAGSFTSIFEIIISGHKRGSTDAFYSADTGIQVAVANIDNFDLTGKYVNNKYNPLTDAGNPNPTNARVTITYDTAQQGAPRGLGFSATGNYEFRHFLIESTGQDQNNLSSNRSTCTIQQKVVRIVPTLQGGN